MMSLMNHSPAAEWSIRKTTDRSDPSFNVIFATTWFGPSIFAETDLIPPVDGQVHRRDPLRQRPIGLRPPLRVRRIETERLGDQVDLTRIRRNIDQKIDRG